MTSAPLLEWIDTHGHRDGASYSELYDFARLNDQAATIARFMADGTWRSAQEIEDGTGVGWASASARLRDLRKAKFGAHTVQRRRRAGQRFGGVNEYRLLLNVERSASSTREGS